MMFSIRALFTAYPELVTPELFRDNTINTLRPNENLDNESRYIKEAILNCCGDLACIYNNPERFSEEIRLWVRTRISIWCKLRATTTYTYDPIANYDRKEKWEDSESVISEGGNISNGNNTQKVAAFNSSTLQESNSNTSKVDSKVNSKVNKKVTHEAELKGNIGVTTTQEMIESERRVVSYSVVEQIAREFKERFCILVY